MHVAAGRTHEHPWSAAEDDHARGPRPSRAATRTRPRQVRGRGVIWSSCAPAQSTAAGAAGGSSNRWPHGHRATPAAAASPACQAVRAAIASRHGSGSAPGRRRLQTRRPPTHQASRGSPRTSSPMITHAAVTVADDHGTTGSSHAGVSTCRPYRGTSTGDRSTSAGTGACEPPVTADGRRAGAAALLLALSLTACSSGDPRPTTTGRARPSPATRPPSRRRRPAPSSTSSPSRRGWSSTRSPGCSRSPCATPTGCSWSTARPGRPSARCRCPATPAISSWRGPAAPSSCRPRTRTPWSRSPSPAAGPPRPTSASTRTTPPRCPAARSWSPTSAAAPCRSSPTAR